MPPPPPELIEELLEEVLIRFPPDDPASLVRAALVCKFWCRLVCDTAFRRRFREFHRGAAPLLGVLYTTGVGNCHKQVRDDDGDDDDDTPRAAADDDDADADRSVKRARILREPATACFVTTTSYRPAHDAGDGRRNGWRAIDAHHGRVLLCQSDPWRRWLALSVWDPVTGERRNLPEAPPPLHTLGYSVAVACAADAGSCCDHLDCHGGPFHQVNEAPESVVSDGLTPSLDAWSTLPSQDLAHLAIQMLGTNYARGARHAQEVSMARLPSEFSGLSEQGSIALVNGDDGELGFVASTQCQLELWSMAAGRDARFVLTRVIDLREVLPSGAPINSSVRVNGFADSGASRFLFMRTSDGLYSIEVNSSHVKKVADCCDDDDGGDVVPYVSLCSPTSRIHGQEYNNFASTGDDVITIAATIHQAPTSDSVGAAAPDARPTTGTVVDSE